MTTLTAKQKRFISEYLIDLNATQAAIRAGYSASSAQQIGAENLLKPVVAEAVKKAMEKREKRAELSQDEVIQDLRELRDICMGRKAAKVTKFVKSGGDEAPIEIEAYVLEPASANKALELLGKHMKMFTEKVDHMSSDGSMTPKTWTPQQAAEELIKQAESLDDE